MKRFMALVNTFLLIFSNTSLGDVNKFPIPVELKSFTELKQQEKKEFEDLSQKMRDDLSKSGEFVKDYEKIKDFDYSFLHPMDESQSFSIDDENYKSIQEYCNKEDCTQYDHIIKAYAAKFFNNAAIKTFSNKLNSKTPLSAVEKKELAEACYSEIGKSLRDKYIADRKISEKVVGKIVPLLEYYVLAIESNNPHIILDIDLECENHASIPSKNLDSLLEKTTSILDFKEIDSIRKKLIGLPEKTKESISRLLNIENLLSENKDLWKKVFESKEKELDAISLILDELDNKNTSKIFEDVQGLIKSMKFSDHNQNSLEVNTEDEKSGTISYNIELSRSKDIIFSEKNKSDNLSINFLTLISTLQELKSKEILNKDQNPKRVQVLSKKTKNSKGNDTLDLVVNISQLKMKLDLEKNKLGAQTKNVVQESLKTKGINYDLNFNLTTVGAIDVETVDEEENKRPKKKVHFADEEKSEVKKTEQDPILEEVKQDKPYIHQSSGTVGIENVGNTCYMNSLLQVMSNSDHLMGCIKKSSAKGKSVFKEMESILSDLNNQKNTCINGNRIKDLYKKLNHLPYQTNRKDLKTQFFDLSQHNQEDPSEAFFKLIEILEGIDLDFTKCLKGNMFVGTASQISYKGGGSNQFEENIGISLPITGSSTDKPTTLLKLLNDFSQSELLTGDNKVEVEVEGKSERVEAQKRLLIHKVPDTIYLHLKRFNSEFLKDSKGNIRFQSFKQTRPIDIPETLKASDLNKLPKINDKDINIFKKDYLLMSFNCHMGSSTSGGHWISIKRSSDNKWYYLNDSQSFGPYSKLEDLWKGEPYADNACRSGSSQFIFRASNN